jgi:cell division protein FtsW
MSFSRADKSRLAQWWFTVDHVLLSAILAIMAVGLVLSLAASPDVAARKGLGPYYFFERHALFSAAGVVLMIAVSLMHPRGVRRLALAVFGIALAGLVVVHFWGAEINGARRWLSLFGHSLQPSEFAKPGFVVVSAWLLSEARERPDMPALPIAVAAFVALALLLIAEPDVGQTMLVTLVWSALFFASGQPASRALVILAGAAMAFLGAYQAFAHVRFRVDRFLNPLPGAEGQVERAMQSFIEGGFFGRGPGEGTIKTALPDAHTDFIFAVVAEEYGMIACLAILGLYAFVVVRVLVKSASEPDGATRLAVMGLALLFGLQALINMGVNVGLLPAKGMTLPFISAGGSSILAVSLTLGMALALTRRRPDASRLARGRATPARET